MKKSLFVTLLLFVGTVWAQTQRCEGTAGPCSWSADDHPPAKPVTPAPVSLPPSNFALPDLNKKVYVKEGSLICQDPGQFLIWLPPYKNYLISSGSCVITGHSVRVQVIESSIRNINAYEPKTNKVVRILVRSNKQSSADVAFLWVRIYDL